MEAEGVRAVHTLPLSMRTEGEHYFRKHVVDFLKSSVVPDSRVLVVGCPDRSVLESLQPTYGVGCTGGESDLETVHEGFSQSSVC